MDRVPAGRLAIIAAASILLAGGVGAWTISRPTGGGQAPAMDIGSLSPEVAAHYRFVEKEPDLAVRIPCYCGCGSSLGHQNLKDCFLKKGGYSDHATTCLICNRIAADVERLLAGGGDAATIRAWVDQEYSQFGPPTHTP